jgi:hypothetical protein
MLGTMVARLLLRIMVFLAVLIGAVVATARADAAWTVTLAVAGLVLAAAGVGMSLRRLLEGADDVTPEAPGRALVAALASVAAIAVVLALTLPVADSSATSTTKPTAAAADRTVRDFLATAVLDDSAYPACQYLTAVEQQRVAALAGDGQTCRAALLTTQPSFDDIHSEGSLHALPLHAVVHGATADVTARPHGRPPTTFVLQRTTPAEAAAYEAPPSAWRIAGGATAVLAR